MWCNDDYEYAGLGVLCVVADVLCVVAGGWLAGCVGGFWRLLVLFKSKDFAKIFKHFRIGGWSLPSNPRPSINSAIGGVQQLCLAADLILPN